MYIAIDFDGTIVEHKYPTIGKPIPGAIDWIKKFQEAGAKIILWTMRSDSSSNGPTLTQAKEFCENNDIKLFGVNYNPTQHEWTSSPKAYAHIYIDDAALGCPLKESAEYNARPYVDWDIVGPIVLDKINKMKAQL